MAALRNRRPYHRTDPHEALEDVLARAMSGPDPVATLKAASDGKLLTLEMRKALRETDEDGVRLTALLVTRRRLERLLAGSADARAWLARDAPRFAAAFRKYHDDVPPSAIFPEEEAEDFRRFCESFHALRTPPPEVFEPRDRRDLIRARHHVIRHRR